MVNEEPHQGQETKGEKKETQLHEGRGLRKKSRQTSREGEGDEGEAGEEEGAEEEGGTREAETARQEEKQWTERLRPGQADRRTEKE